jgi:hypothetical protein
MRTRLRSERQVLLEMLFVILYKYVNFELFVSIYVVDSRDDHSNSLSLAYHIHTELSRGVH